MYLTIRLKRFNLRYKYVHLIFSSFEIEMHNMILIDFRCTRCCQVFCVWYDGCLIGV